MAGHYGIKVSTGGENVSEADPDLLVYNSAWNSLKIVESGNEASSTDPHLISHSVGYECVFLTYVEDSGGYRNSSHSSHITSSQISAPVDSVGDKVAYFVFSDYADDTSTEFTATRESGYGMKMSNEGEDVYDASDTKLSFSSSHNTLQIRDVFTNAGPSAGGTETITHNYGYIPAFTAQIELNSAGNYNLMPYANAVPGGTVKCIAKTNTIDIVSDGNIDASGDTIQVILFTEGLE
jgi:hypothetical protein